MSLQALLSASTGMEAQLVRMSNIANNISNLNTTGFKASRESFEDLLYEQLQVAGAKNGANTEAPVGIQIGNGTRLAGVYKNFNQGDFVQTNRDLDVAIEGEGFFEVTTDKGTPAYTRDGSFRINKDGTMVNNQGLVLNPSITVPVDATFLTIGTDGTVSVTTGGDATPTELGQLQVVMFQNPSGLQAKGGNLFEATEASGTPTTLVPGDSGAGSLRQRFLENSNVNISEELINMIVAQRSYEANSKVLSTTNEMLRSNNNVL